MSSLFPADLSDPWSDPPVNSSSPSIPSLVSPVSIPTVVRDNEDSSDNGYLYGLIERNDDLLMAVHNIKKAVVPTVYDVLYNKNIRKDGFADFNAIENICDIAGLNQISIENILNLVTLNQTIHFTVVDHSLWNVIVGLLALEQQNLGGGNFQNLEIHINNLPELILEETSNQINNDPMTGSIWSESSKILTEPSAASTANHSNNSSAKLSKYSMVDTYNVRRLFNPNKNDVITVQQIAEKEGLVFKHINYLVSHSIDLSEYNPSDGKKVVRRYSDFVWLQEVLSKKYPFRMVPSLPPKSFSGGNNDPLFLERRKRGLSRFLNLIMKHPILSDETMVIMFLTIPTELSMWRKQTNVEISEEFEGKRISKKFIDSWNDNNEAIWKSAEESLSNVQNSWAKITVLVERFEKRKQLYNTDNEKLIQVLTDFVGTTSKIYPVEPSDIDTINVGIQNLNKHIRTSAALLKDESQLIEEGILKEFKEFNEYLTSIYTLFERRKHLGGNNISELKKKVEQNQAKLSQLKKKSDVKGSEVDNLVQTINEDKQKIIGQTNRDWLIRECIQHEFLMFQETQYKITKVFQEWVGDRLKYSELHSENWSQLMDSLQEMPLNTV